MYGEESPPLRMAEKPRAPKPTLGWKTSMMPPVSRR
jgi:hypothetical protein